MTTEQIKNLNIGIDTEDIDTVLKAEAAVEWIAEHTTIDTTDLENFPARAKLFIKGFIQISKLKPGVASHSIEGLSLSFTGGNKADMIWDLATTLLRTDIKSQIQFIPAQRRFV